MPQKKSQFYLFIIIKQAFVPSGTHKQKQNKQKKIQIVEMNTYFQNC